MSNFATYPSLTDRLVIVSGGATGIGAAIVETFLQSGANVALLDVDDKNAVKLIESLFQRYGKRPHFYNTDLRDIKQLQVTFERVIEQHGPVKVLVNNAARDDRHNIEDVTEDFWRNCLSINLDHYFFSSQKVSANMRENNGGSIINMSSISWVAGMANLTGYAAANAAIVGMGRTMARELGPHNIRINSVIPGWILTDRQIDKWLTPVLEQSWLDRQCLKQMVRPEEVARFVAFLGADDSRMITSQSFAVDGGYR